MKHIGVYISYFDTVFEPGHFGPMIYKNIGDLEYYRYTDAHTGYFNPEKVNLWIDDDQTLDSIFDDDRLNRYPYVYRAYATVNDVLIVTDYFQHEDDAINDMRKRTHGKLSRANMTTQACELNVNVMEPVVYPCLATAIMGRKTLMIHRNFHPEMGCKALRYYYPDKSCGPLYPGDLIVTSTFDPTGKPFGFFKGYNPKLPDIDEEILAHKIIDMIKDRRADFWRGVIEFYDTFIGQMVVVKKPDGTNLEYLCMDTDENDEPAIVYKNSLFYVYGDKDNTVLRESIHINDFLSQGYQGCSFDEFQQKFKAIPEFVNGYNCQRDLVTIPTFPVVADMADIGCVILRKIGESNVPAYFINFTIGGWRELITNFTPKEIDEGIAHMQETNMNANRLAQMEEL